VKKLLIIDDDPTLLSALARFFSSQGFSVVASCDFPEPAAFLDETSVDLAILDVTLGASPREGFRILRSLKETAPDLPVVMFTGRVDPDTADQATELGAAAVVPKTELDDLARVVRSLLVP
jgi:DNA-binding NarL/FixJ family response regulator